MLVKPDCYIWRPRGQVEIKLDVPEDPNPYVISSIVLHPEYGLSIAKDVIQVSGSPGNCVFYSTTFLAVTDKNGLFHS